MNSFAFDPNVLAVPFTFGCIVAALIAWFLMLGGSLKISLGMTMKEAPRYLHCLLMVALIMVGNLAVFIGMYVLMGPQPWYIIACYQSLVQIVLMMIVARCNPFAAFFASLFHGFFASMGTVAIAIVFVLFCGTALQGAKERSKGTGSFQSRQARSQSWFKDFNSNSSPSRKKGFPVRPVRFSDNPFIK